MPLIDHRTLHHNKQLWVQYAVSNLKATLREVHTFHALYISKNTSHSFLFACSAQLKLKIEWAERNELNNSPSFFPSFFPYSFSCFLLSFFPSSFPRSLSLSLFVSPFLSLSFHSSVPSPVFGLFIINETEDVTSFLCPGLNLCMWTHSSMFGQGGHLINNEI